VPSPTERDPGDDETIGWDDIGFGPWPGTVGVPHQAPSARDRVHHGLPDSLAVVAGDGVVQRAVFEPALKQYTHALRAGEPRFASAEQGARWHTARRRAIDHILRAVAESPWSDSLVLRGSTLLRAWYGEAAREPGDLDFVVVPTTWNLPDERTDRMLADVGDAAERLSRLRDGSEHLDVRIDASGALSDEIWTYERVPGRRLVLPWNSTGLPAGTVQLDFVFNEEQLTEPEVTHIPRRGGGGAGTIRLLAASRAQSLAWKVLWLVTDRFPQGKDLYDAVLLAESTTPDALLLRRTLVASHPRFARQAPKVEAATRRAQLDEFRKEYPDLATDDLPARLCAALESTLAQDIEPPGDTHTRIAHWLAPRITRWRVLAAEQGLAAVLSEARRESCALEERVVVVREILGPRTIDVPRAVALVAKDEDWYADRNSLRGRRRELRRMIEHLS